MSQTREDRRRAIATIIEERAPASQEELATELARLGFAVTQATISRDLEQLGAMKMRRGGRLAYALPLAEGPQPTSRLGGVLRDWVRAIAVAGNLVVVKTGPGSAHLVGVAMDEAQVPGIAGTICGDDTIFAATASSSEAQAVAARLEGLRSGEA